MPGKNARKTSRRYKYLFSKPFSFGRINPKPSNRDAGWVLWRAVHRFTRKQHPNAWVQILPPRTTTNLGPCFWYSNHQFGVQWSPSHRLYCPERTQLEIWDRYTPVTKNAKWLDMFGTHQTCWVMINSTFIGHPPLSKIRKGEALDTACLTWGSNSCEGPVVTHWGTGAILGLHLGGIAILGDVRWGYQGWPSPAIRKQEELGPLTPIGKLMETVCLNMSLQNRSGYVQTMFASCLRWNVYFPQR